MNHFLFVRPEEAERIDPVLEALRKAAPAHEGHNNHLRVNPEQAASVLIVLLGEIMASVRDEDREGAVSDLMLNLHALAAIAPEARAESGLY